MRFKTIVTVGCLLVGSYWTGKAVGAHDGAKTVLNKYKDIIPDKELVVKLIDKVGFKMTVTAKKDK